MMVQLIMGASLVEGHMKNDKRQYLLKYEGSHKDCNCGVFTVLASFETKEKEHMTAMCPSEYFLFLN